MAFTEDFAPFMQQAEFADSALLAGAPVQVIFDRAYSDGQGIASGAPVVQIPSSSVPSNVVGLPLVISTGVGAGSYTVHAHEPDGTGFSTLELRKA
jgi:hypothetical protein